MKSSACPRLPSIFSAAGNIWTCCRWLTNFQKRLCPMAILAIGGSPYSFSSIYKPYNFPFRVASAASTDLGGFSTSPSLSSISREDESAAYSGIETALDSVVKIFTVSSSPNYLLPWQNKPPHETWGSGFAVPGKRIITSAHVVADHTFIQVRKPCSPTECRGHALSVGHECDLAILGWTVKNSGRARVFSSLEAFRSYKMK